ncbi:hypothetical protein [Halomonas sp. BM-2019]|uniref:hypothetical protein n=1 Tax=Halomonas sp. BM-2019 TaxID=2811227 RepID=UPI001B3C2D50|nr:MAG: hypothetical protein J5F18_09715 [Halomonas sp. BM-2019]
MTLALARPAWPMALASCSEPVVFPGAAVNAVILPYRYTGPDRFNPLSQTGEQLSGLLHLEVLFSMLKYGSVGATQLMGEPGGCELTTVTEKVLGIRSADWEIQPGRGVVFLWGKLYEEGSDIYVQSYARFLRRDAREEVQLTIDGAAGSGFQFIAHLPLENIAFAPRRLSRNDLEHIQTEFQRSVVIRPSPDLSQSGEPLPIHGEAAAYWVTDVRGEWMHIASQFDEVRGWVRARPDPADWPLRQKLPELAYLDGVAGFLRYQASQEANGVSPSPDRTIESISRAFQVYEEAAQERHAPEAAATWRAILGFMHLVTAVQEPERREAAREAEFLLREAVQLVPYNGDLRNLAFLASFYLSSSRPPSPDGDRLITELLDALAVDPENEDVLTNLEQLYAYMITQPARAPFSTAEIQRRLDAVQQVKVRMRE